MARGPRLVSGRLQLKMPTKTSLKIEGSYSLTADEFSSKFYMKTAIQLLTAYSNWKWPDFESLSTFKGKLMHTARWNQEYT